MARAILEYSLIGLFSALGRVGWTKFICTFRANLEQVCPLSHAYPSREGRKDVRELELAGKGDD